jgi:uncharacterized protein
VIMAQASRAFQIFAKPTGPFCNLDCRYCYYVRKEGLYGKGASLRMPDHILESYIAQHIEASPDPVIRFSWHGGEPTLLGLEYFRKIVWLQQKHLPPGRRISNGMQTNGTLLDEEWCRFFAEEGFSAGISLDGPQELHDQYRVDKRQAPTHERAMQGYRLLRRYGIPTDILCVVHAQNVVHPLEVYRFFREMGATYIGFLPLVELRPGGGLSDRTVPAEGFGHFLCAIFDEWLSRDIGRIRVQIFEEAIGTAFGQEHALCIFRETCGDIPVIEHNGDFFSCDHFVDREHHLGNVMETALVELLESPSQRGFGQAKRDGLPRMCRACASLIMCNGGCPKDRFMVTPDGEKGLNYLCPGYKRFFAHCRPFVSQVAAMGTPPPDQGRVIPVLEGAGQEVRKVGRNDPCPCGSGRKYKKCCGR